MSLKKEIKKFREEYLQNLAAIKEVKKQYNKYLILVILLAIPFVATIVSIIYIGFLLGTYMFQIPTEISYLPALTYLLFFSGLLIYAGKRNQATSEYKSKIEDKIKFRISGIVKSLDEYTSGNEEIIKDALRDINHLINILNKTLLNFKPMFHYDYKIEDALVRLKHVLELNYLKKITMIRKSEKIQEFLEKFEEIFLIISKNEYNTLYEFLEKDYEEIRHNVEKTPLFSDIVILINQLLLNKFSRIIVALIFSVMVYCLVLLLSPTDINIIMGAAIPSIVTLTYLIEKIIDRFFKDRENIKKENIR